MASKAPPPLIRSTKAFSVEIPEGSNSAKARRSDVVGSGDTDIHSNASNFESGQQLDDASQGFHEDQSLGLNAAFAEEHAAQTNDTVKESHDGLKDRFASDLDDHGHAVTMVNEGHDHLDNLAKLPNDDHHAADSGVGVAKDMIKDRLQGIGTEAFKDNLQGIGNEAIHDNLQGVDNEAIHDNLQVVGNEAIHDNLQGVDNEAIHDNLQGIGNEAIHDNKAGIAKENLEDHMAPLPSTAHDLKDGPQAGRHPETTFKNDHADEVSASHHARGQPKAESQKKLTAEEVAAHAQAALQAQQEKVKKMEEFHGRVDAIRKTVSGINHKLDELDDEGAPIKR